MKITDIITENYDNWDHKYPAEYSKHLEKTFGSPDEMTEQEWQWWMMNESRKGRFRTGPGLD